ncbi:hypothetical protein ACO0K0_07395 [Undibacterium sp. SXout11W]|uniref:hypothetical protein n=1 Tax=Undibacterium sp. SXout11W TaxID=3413050 RepID=UPI003BF248C7
MRDIPDIHGYALLELPFNHIVRQGSEKSQSTDNILWTNIVSDSIKGWVFAAGVTPYTPQTRFNAITNFKVDENATEIKRESKLSEKEFKTLKNTGRPYTQTTTAAPATNSSSALYEVVVNDLAMRSAPEINAQLLKKLQLGQLVAGLPQTVRDSWIAIHVDGHMGWVSHQWIRAISTN